MHSELEACQKALDGYLEQKRGMFPRFYFVSNPTLLQILSQGSDPQMIQPYYQTVFDSISYVIHDKDNPRQINTIVSRFKGCEEEIPLFNPVMCKGMIEDWIAKLKFQQQVTMKEICRHCSEEIDTVGNDIGSCVDLWTTCRLSTHFLASSSCGRPTFKMPSKIAG